jgi:hypothetical protein
MFGRAAKEVDCAVGRPVTPLLLELVWMILAYKISSTVLVLTAGRLSDLFGALVLHELSHRDSARGFDLAGTLAFVLGLTGLVYGVSRRRSASLFVPPGSSTASRSGSQKNKAEVLL